MLHFYTPWKQENLQFLYVFGGYRSGALVENGLDRYLAVVEEFEQKRRLIKVKKKDSE